MQFYLDPIQKGFYRSRRWILLEDLWDEPTLHMLYTAELAKATSEEKLFLGRDRFRRGKEFQKIFCGRYFSCLVKNLLDRPVSRYLLDQWFDQEVYQLLMKNKPPTISTMFSVQGVLMAVIIALENCTEIDEPPSSQLGNKHKMTLPKKSGSFLFLTPERFFEIDALLKSNKHSFELILIGETDSRFYPSPKDPYSSHLKKLGYGAGDRLLDNTHPVLR